jgi:hypothetical protein
LRTKPTTKLLTHRTVARMVDIDTETLREWVAVGEWPEPHAIVRQTWFYKSISSRPGSGFRKQNSSRVKVRGGFASLIQWSEPGGCR